MNAVRKHVEREIRVRAFRRSLAEHGIIGCLARLPYPPTPRRLYKRARASGVAIGLVGSASFAALTNTMTASGTQTVPAGASFCTVELWGDTGAGGTGSGSGCTASGGGGGGSGGYSRTGAFNVSTKNGLTWTVTLGTGGTGSGNSTIIAGTMTGWTSMTGGNGGNGGNGPAGAAGAAGAIGTGGTSANTAGNAGTAGTGSSGGNGGNGVVGTNGTGNSGGHGGFSTLNTGRTLGNTGKAIFAYT